ncbi:MAG: hypothetical protein QM705_07005 [Ancrocorticia sp.]
MKRGKILRVIAALAIGAISACSSGSGSEGGASVTEPGASTRATTEADALPRGLHLAVVVSPNPSEDEQAVLAAVDSYQALHGGTVEVYQEEAATDSVSEAIAAAPDVVVAVGPFVVGAVDLESAQHLDTPFLVLGMELAEPTENVVAVTWPGADSRAALAEDTLEFTQAAMYADDAVAAGLQALQSAHDAEVVKLR